jgi:hypothetical protein
VNAKLVELAHDAVPGLMRVGLLVNPAGANRALVEAQVVAAGRARGVTTLVEEASRSDALAPALDRMAKGCSSISAARSCGKRSPRDCRRYSTTVELSKPAAS